MLLTAAVKNPEPPSLPDSTLASPRDDFPDRLLVTYKGAVYDLASFISDHPGGEDVLREWAGRDISEIFHSPDSHQHSKSALLMLEKYKILEAPIVTAAFAEENNTNEKKKEEQEKEEQVADPNFLDLEKPLIWQLLTKRNLEKMEYLTQVHIGRHLNKPALLFHNPILERLSHTPWWVIPTVWTPFIAFAYLKTLDYYNRDLAGCLFVLGVFTWTLMEYLFHRFLFHIDECLPEKGNLLYTLHFTIHGVHHFLPMDKERLVMPPALMAILSGSVWIFLRLFLRLPIGVMWGLYAGAITGYIVYDMIHYYSHHGQPSTWYLKWIKRYHHMHHYFNPHLGFGVSTPLWDYIFGTMIEGVKV